ncbi:DDE-type integrase/transposase/recombinase [Flavobacterium sp. 9]
MWCYLYRALDKIGNTVDFLLIRKRTENERSNFSN